MCAHFLAQVSTKMAALGVDFVLLLDLRVGFDPYATSDLNKLSSTANFPAQLLRKESAPKFIFCSRTARRVRACVHTQVWAKFLSGYTGKDKTARTIQYGAKALR